MIRPKSIIWCAKTNKLCSKQNLQTVHNNLVSTVQYTEERRQKENCRAHFCWILYNKSRKMQKSKMQIKIEKETFATTTSSFFSSLLYLNASFSNVPLNRWQCPHLKWGKYFNRRLRPELPLSFLDETPRLFQSLCLSVVLCIVATRCNIYASGTFL